MRFLLRLMFGVFLGAVCAPLATAAATISGALAVSPATVGYARSVALTAALAVPAGSPDATGTVTFSVDGGPLTPASVVAANSATYTVASAVYAVGVHSVTAVYSGDANYNPVTLSGSFTVTLLPSQTYMTDVVSPIHYGEVIGDVAKGYALPLQPTDTVLLDGGNLDFLIDGTVVCTLPVISGLTQTCPSSTGAGYSVGTYTLSAAYRGNAFYAPSTSPGYTVQVLPGETSGGLTSTANPAFVGTAVKITATFTTPFATPVGAVTFFDGASVVGSGVLDPGGVASFTTSTLAIGTHALTARLAASLNFNAATTPVLQQAIVPPNVTTSTQLTSSLNPSTVGQSVTFTARVLGAGTGVPTPTGTVAFTADGASLGLVPLDATGAASVTLSTLAIGSHIVVATYSGFTSISSTTFSPSATTLIEQVNPLPGFTLSVTPTALRVPIGNYASTLIAVVPINGFSAPVALTCAGLPRGVTCTFDTQTIANASGTTYLRIFATAPHDCDNSAPYFVTPAGSVGVFGLLGAGTLLLVRRRRRLVKGLALGVALAVLPMLSGCSHCTDLGVFPGDYTFTVTATGGTVTASSVVRITAHL